MEGDGARLPVPQSWVTGDPGGSSLGWAGLNAPVPSEALAIAGIGF